MTIPDTKPKRRRKLSSKSSSSAKTALSKTPADVLALGQHLVRQTFSKKYRKQGTLYSKTISNNSIFSQIKIGFYNINGIKGNYYKAQELIELRTSSKLDIISITETNI